MLIAPWRKHLHHQFRLSKYDFMTGTLEVTINLCVINRFIKHECSAWLYYTDLQVVSQSRCSFVCLLVITWQQAWWQPAQSLRPALVINLIKSLCPTECISGMLNSSRRAGYCFPLPNYQVFTLAFTLCTYLWQQEGCYSSEDTSALKWEPDTHQVTAKAARHVWRK